MDRVAREHSFHWAAADYGARRVHGSRMQAVQSDPGRGVRSLVSGRVPQRSERLVQGWPLGWRLDVWLFDGARLGRRVLRLEVEECTA